MSRYSVTEHQKAGAMPVFLFSQLRLQVLAHMRRRAYSSFNETNNAPEGKTMKINFKVIEEIKAEAAEFGFNATTHTIARDYFNRMSYEDKSVVMAMVQPQKGVTALSRACVAKVADLIAA